MTGFHSVIVDWRETYEAINYHYEINPDVDLPPECWAEASLMLSGVETPRYNGYYKSISTWLSRVIQRLRDDPTTRRAIIIIRHDEPDTDPTCLSSIQFFYRRGKLMTICNFRSQEMEEFVKYDSAVILLIVRTVAEELNYEIGQIFCNVASAHFFEMSKLQYKYA